MRFDPLPQEMQIIVNNSNENKNFVNMFVGERWDKTNGEDDSLPATIVLDESTTV